MNLKESAATFFDNWLKPVVLYIAILLLFFIADSLFKSIILNNIVFCFLVLGISIIVFSIFYQLSKKNHLNSFLTLSVLVVGLELMFVLFSLGAFIKIMTVHISNKLSFPKDDNPTQRLDSSETKPATFSVDTDTSLNKN